MLMHHSHPPLPVVGHDRHRARIRAAKRITGKSESAIAEILGIAPSSSMSTSTSTPAAPTPPPSSSYPSTPAPEPSLSLDKLTTSTKSVADYFKEKLLARSSSSSSSSPASSSAPSGSATPGLGATGLGFGSSNVFPPDGEDEPPRRGIGSRAPAVPPPSQVPEAGSVSGGGDADADGRDLVSEKQRRRAERKAEKRKRREAEASQTTSEDVSTIVNEQMNEDHTEVARRTSKEKRQKERRPNGNDKDIEDTTEKGHEHDTSSGPLPETSKKSKKEGKKKQS